MSDGTPFLRVAADRIGAPGSARIAGKNAIPRHQRRQLVLNHPDRREDGRHSKGNCTSSGFESHSTGWEGAIWGIPVYKRLSICAINSLSVIGERYYQMTARQERPKCRFANISVVTIAAAAAIFSAVSGFFAYKTADRANQISERQMYLQLSGVSFDFVYDDGQDSLTVKAVGASAVFLTTIWVKPNFLDNAGKFQSGYEVPLPVRDNREVHNVKKVICTSEKNKGFCIRADSHIESYHIRYDVEDYLDVAKGVRGKLLSQRSQLVSAKD